MATQRGLLTIDGNAGEIAHVLVVAREAVEEGGLAAVDLSGQSEGEERALGEGAGRGVIVVLTCLAKTGVRVVLV